MFWIILCHQEVAISLFNQIKISRSFIFAQFVAYILPNIRLMKR